MSNYEEHWVDFRGPPPRGLPSPDAPIQTTAGVGRKDDTGKVRMELLADLARAQRAVAEVMTFAVEKKKPVPYEPGSWLGVEPFFPRYRGALGRHLTEVDLTNGNGRDAETGLLELAHLATNAMFLLEKKLRSLEGKQ